MTLSKFFPDLVRAGILADSRLCLTGSGHVKILWFRHKGLRTLRTDSCESNSTTVLWIPDVLLHRQRRMAEDTRVAVVTS
jgi:hypothetical protein